MRFACRRVFVLAIARHVATCWFVAIDHDSLPNTVLLTGISREGNMIPLILLKVPIVYILDQLFVIGFAFPELKNALWAAYSKNNTDHVCRTYTNSTICQTENNDKFTQYYYDVVLATLKMVICCWIFILMIFIILLSAKYTHTIYLHIISIIVVIVSGWGNVQTLNMLSVKYEQFEMDQINKSIIWERDGIMNNLMIQCIGDILYVIFCNFVIQLILSMAFEYFQSHTKYYLNYRISSCICFAIPTIFTFIPSTWDVLNTITVLLTLYPVCKMLFLNICITLINILSYWSRYSVEYLLRDFGIFVIVLDEWKRLKIPLVFQIFWVMRVMKQFLCLLANTEMANKTIYDIITYLITEGCNTFISLSGIISFILYFCHYLEVLMHKILLTDILTDGYIKETGTVLFCLLALITGLTGLEPNERLTQLFQNICVVWVVIMNIILRSCRLILVSEFIPHDERNTKAVIVCVFMILFAVTMSTYLWSYHSIGRFLILISTLNIQTIFNVSMSLVLYTLFVMDANFSFYRWLNLEDFVFYIKTFEFMIDFGFNIFILLVSAYVNWLDFFSKIIHVLLLGNYFVDNVCVQVEKHWILFVNRQLAVRKIRSMLDATSEQLTEYNSFCVICYENMDTAKVTNCKHYFHGMCLRKWLYINEHCPICIKPLFNAE